MSFGVTDGVEQTGRHRADESERVTRRRREAERDLSRVRPLPLRRTDPPEETPVAADPRPEGRRATRAKAPDDDDPNGYRRIEPDVEQARAARAARRELSGDPARSGPRNSDTSQPLDAGPGRSVGTFSRGMPRNRRIETPEPAEPIAEPARESRRLSPRVSRASRRRPDDEEDLLAWARPDGTDSNGHSGRAGPDSDDLSASARAARSALAADPPAIGRQRGPATGRATVSGVASPSASAAPVSDAPAKGSASANGRGADAPATLSRPARAIARLGRTSGGRPLAGEPEFVHRVNPFELPDPRGYVHATVAQGQLVFLAGQPGVDLDGRIVDGGIVKQFDRAVQNLLIALAAAGGGPEHLAAVTVQVTDLDEYKTNSRPIGHVWRSRLGGAFPALSLMEVRRFWDPLAVVQLDGHAVLP